METLTDEDQRDRYDAMRGEVKEEEPPEEKPFLEYDAGPEERERERRDREIREEQQRQEWEAEVMGLHHDVQFEEDFATGHVQEKNRWGLDVHNGYAKKYGDGGISCNTNCNGCFLSVEQSESHGSKTSCERMPILNKRAWQNK